MRRHRIVRLMTAGLLAGLAGCTVHPPPGTGGAAELAGAAAWPPPGYWTGEPVHPELRATVPHGTDLGAPWVAQRLESISCLDFRLEGLDMSGASELFPAEVILARADRRRAIRALMGGLPRDGEIDLLAYRTRVHRIETGLLRSGRPVSPEVRDLQC